MTDPVPLAVTLTSNSTQDTSLYRTRENVLALRLAGPAMQLAAGTDAAATVIQIDWAGLLAADELAAVKIAADGWTGRLIDSGGAKLWELRPTRNASVPAGTPQVFAVTVPKVAAQPTSATICIQYQNIGGVADDFVNMQMFVVAPPPENDKPKPLPVSIGWATDQEPVVYVSLKKNDLIPNRLRFYISNDGATALGAAGGTAEFQISFITIAQPAPSDPRPNPGLNALTYEAEARSSIKLTPFGDGAATWKIVPPEPGKPLLWSLQPQSKQILDADAAVQILVEDIRTTLPAFSTTLFVHSVVDIAGYEGRVQRLHFDKALPHPGILMFDADRREIAAGDTVDLAWRTQALDGLELSYLESNRRIVKSYQNKDIGLADHLKVTPEVTTSYTLTPYSNGRKLAAFSIEIAVAQPDPVIHKFIADPAGPVECAPGKGVPITLRWEVSGAHTLELDGIKTVRGTSDTVTIYGSRTFVLRAQNRDGILTTADVTVAAQKPVIKSFTATPNLLELDSGPKTVRLSWEVSGASTLLIGDVGRVSGLNVDVPNIRQSRDFVLQATNPDGETVTASVQVLSFRDFLTDRSCSLMTEKAFRPPDGRGMPMQFLNEWITFSAGSSAKYTFIFEQGEGEGYPTVVAGTWTINQGDLTLTTGRGVMKLQMDSNGLTLASTTLVPEYGERPSKHWAYCTVADVPTMG